VLERARGVPAWAPDSVERGAADVHATKSKTATPVASLDLAAESEGDSTRSRALVELKLSLV
jgi:hypothetical protein